MKRFQAKRDAAALNSRLVRRPIQRMVWLFLLPTFAAFCIGFIYPFLKGAFLSFCKFKLTSKWTWVGFDNYLKAFADSSFRHAFLFTALFAFVSVLFINALAFAVAYALTRGIKGSNLFRTVFFMPNLIGGIVLGYVWQFVFNNVLIKMTNNISLLSKTNTAMMAIIVVYIWQYAGYIMLIYVTGLTQVPKDVLEASQIDGANAVTTLFKIKIPMIAATITICTFLTLTSAFKQFDVNMALTNGTGSVASFFGNYLTNGTQMLALNIYNTAISKNNYALGQAKAILFFIILAAVSIIQVRISNKKEVEM